MKFGGEFGLQFTIHIANQYSTEELVQLAQLAHEEGFKQVWVNDNLQHRSVLVVLSAIAARVPIKIGTAILVPYFRNPVDVADSVAALSELTAGREVSLGIARGAMAPAGQQVRIRKPISMVQETTRFLKALLKGDLVSVNDFPTVASYHNFVPDARFQLAFAPSSPIKFYSGGNGPKMHKFAGEEMDGVLMSGAFITLLRLGAMDSLMSIANNAAMAVQGKRLYNVCEVNISISRDRAEAKRFTKPYVAQVIGSLGQRGVTEDQYSLLGLTVEKVRRVTDALERGIPIETVADLISDKDVDMCFVAGDPDECREGLNFLINEASRLGFEQISLAKLGPDYDEAIKLLRSEVLDKIT